MAQLLKDLGNSRVTDIDIGDMSLPDLEDQIKHDGLIKIVERDGKYLRSAICRSLCC